MRKTKPWFRVYWTDLLADGLAVYFSDAEIGIYYKLYGAARASPTPGVILLNPEDPRDISALAQRLHTRKDRLTATLNKLEKQGKVTRDGTGITITTWDIDQEGPEDNTEGKPEGKQGKLFSQSKKALTEQKAEWKRLGLCEHCGEEGHNKYACPHSKYFDMVKR